MTALRWRGLPSGLLLGWLAFSAANLFSVARFAAATVVVLTLALPALIIAVAAGRERLFHPAPDAAVAVVLVGIAVTVETMRFLSYLPPGWRTASVHVVAATCVVCAGLWVSGRRRTHDLALGAAALALAVTTAISVCYDPFPRIDVWVLLQQSIDGLLDGRNPYETRWIGSTGVEDAFTYLP